MNSVIETIISVSVAICAAFGIYVLFRLAIGQENGSVFWRRMEDSVNTLKIIGSVEGIVYSNEENGYTICDIATGDGDVVTVVGYLPYISEGDNVTVYGKWVHNVKYGRQFAAEMFERTLPSDTASMLRYLSSRTIKGIGPKTARKIIDEFGEDTFDVIENHPEWLARLSGITPKRAREISEDFKEKAGRREAMIFFREWFGSAATVKIYKKWGSRSVDIAKKNPYILCEEIDGIGFERADTMASGLGIEKNSPDRICSGVIFTLLRNERQNGHVCLPRDKLAAAAAALLEVSINETESAISELLKQEKAFCSVFEGEKFIYSAHSYREERYIAEKLEKIDRMCPSVSLPDIESLILKTEADNGINYASLQKKAISDALISGVTVITGGPGTGKTTVVRALIGIFDSMDLEIALAAPTGRAAKRMSEATSREAKTIHRLLEMGFNGEDSESAEFNRDENDPLEEDVIIIDEASMIDNALMYSLLRAVRPGTRLVIIGDADQLPSVGAGNVLRDIISSERFATVRLTEIFRQAQKSLIVTNAHAINKGQMPNLTLKDNDFFFLPRQSDASTAQTVAELYSKRLPKAYGEGTLQGIQVISPSRRGETGTENLNVILQECLNPPSSTKREYKYRDTVFREGDRVMQTRNNYDIEWTCGKKRGSGIFNGDIGIIESIGRADMTIIFDDKVVEYDFTLLEDLESAYAITVHKSQGSEYPTVIMPLGSVPSVLCNRNLLYTAVTRAKTRVILVGRESVIAAMAGNEQQSLRYTGLYHRLKT